MDYKEFQRLYDGDRVVFSLGMELFLENGRDSIIEHTEEELGQVVGKQLSKFFTQEKVAAAVRAAKDFAQLNTAILLVYISKCGFQLESEAVDVSGVCPVCGGPLIYGENAAGHDGAIGWTCQDCGATGKEVYRQVFDHHEDVRLGDGRPVPPREK